ncbi:PREDICTED: B456_003G087000 [Prunus dulcis]|uniref:PREDICTED: B456_003G087000 n=1 Tax=Prunus dulcis TaxID=3755 RepID=A0A5E4FZ19_PRUDU|nr:PREDICTED: B456_003G087000 [Prunus dulcis]
MWKEYKENLSEMKMWVRKLEERELVNEMEESRLKEGMKDKLVCSLVCRWAVVVRMGRVGTQNRRQSIKLVFLLLLIRGRLVKVVVYGFGQDVVGAVETGFGKKQAFGLPIFAMLVGGRRKHYEGRVVATCMKLGARGATHVEGVTRVDLSENSSFSNLLLINGTARPLKW